MSNVATRRVPSLSFPLPLSYRLACFWLLTLVGRSLFLFLTLAGFPGGLGLGYFDVDFATFKLLLVEFFLGLLGRLGCFEGDESVAKGTTAMLNNRCIRTLQKKNITNVSQIPRYSLGFSPPKVLTLCRRSQRTWSERLV